MRKHVIVNLFLRIIKLNNALENEIDHLCNTFFWYL